jgi:hypothetical protein
LHRLLKRGTKPGRLTAEELAADLAYAHAAGSLATPRTGASPALPTENEIQHCLTRTERSSDRRRRKTKPAPEDLKDRHALHVFDLEWNGAGRQQVPKAVQDAIPFEIIEIGAVKLDEQFAWPGNSAPRSAAPVPHLDLALSRP